MPDLNQKLVEIIQNSDFDKVGVVDFRLQDNEVAHLKEWLDLGMHGDMEYMENSLGIRGDIRHIFPDTQSVIVTLTQYKRVKSHKPFIASYAHNFRDYHITIKDKLYDLLKALQQADTSIQGRAVVDSAPTFERAWAVSAGLGWIGRNSMLINPQLGSYTLIGLLPVNRKINFPNKPQMADRCPPGCNLCRRSCPNDAINGNRTVDARRCISYITIESKGSIIGAHGHIHGCDICINACPHNRNVEQIEPTINEDWLQISESEFKNRYKGSSLYRSGIDKIKAILSEESTI